MPFDNDRDDSGQPILAAETIHTPGGVHNFLLAGVERMRMAGYFHFDQRIVLAVGPPNGFLGGNRGASEKGEVAGDVLKYDFTVSRMGIFLHDC